MEHRDPLTERIITCCYRVYTGLGSGFVVENKIIVEVKAVTGNIPDVFKYQVLSYLRALALKVGLLVNLGDKSCQVKRLTFNLCNQV